jgi:hypothetical protein
VCVFVSAGVAAMLWKSLLLVACLAVVAQAKVRRPAHYPKGEPQLRGPPPTAPRICTKYIRLFYITGDVRQTPGVS